MDGRNALAVFRRDGEQQFRRIGSGLQILRGWRDVDGKDQQ